MKLAKKYLAEVNELEPLVIETIDQIEEGLKVIDNQLSIGDAGRPDILAVDDEGTFTIIELKSVVATVDALSQGIRYYEFFLPNIESIARTFKQVKPKNGIRLIFIAPDFDDNIVRVSKYVDLFVSLVKYIGLENSKTKEIGIIYEDIDTEPIQQVTYFKSREDILDYFQVEEVRKDLEKILKELSKNNVIIRPYKGGKRNWIECLFGNDEICYFRPRQKFFLCQTWDEKEEDWSKPARIYNYNEWNKKFKQKVYKYIENES